MLRLTKNRRDILADKFGDLANLAAGALVFGQAIGEDVFSPRVAILGMVVWSMLTGLTYTLAGEGR